eukprot:gb/GECH01010217.1/.p1 GENE.gb/GECH01010217.1/~~gb/GECH01010217.1/.p1  ORF type:complete len:394 (+),score=64.58 gb/GECH01010217.1/:1-1182(+)
MSTTNDIENTNDKNNSETLIDNSRPEDSNNIQENNGNAQDERNTTQTQENEENQQSDEDESSLIPKRIPPRKSDLYIQLAYEANLLSRECPNSLYDKSSIIKDVQRRKSVISSIINYYQQHSNDEKVTQLKNLEERLDQRKTWIESLNIREKEDHTPWILERDIFNQRTDYNQSIRFLKDESFESIENSTDNNIITQFKCEAAQEPVKNLEYNFNRIKLKKSQLQKEQKIQDYDVLYNLRIDISHISFSYHPLMNTEEFLVSRMKELISWISYYSSEEEEYDKILSEIGRIWLEIEKTRKREGFISTSAKLGFKIDDDIKIPILLNNATCSEDKDCPTRYIEEMRLEKRIIALEYWRIIEKLLNQKILIFILIFHSLLKCHINCLFSSGQTLL